MIKVNLYINHLYHTAVVCEEICKQENGEMQFFKDKKIIRSYPIKDISLMYISKEISE